MKAEPVEFRSRPRALAKDRKGAHVHLISQGPGAVRIADNEALRGYQANLLLWRFLNLDQRASQHIMTPAR